MPQCQPQIAGGHSVQNSGEILFMVLVVLCMWNNLSYCLLQNILLFSLSTSDVYSEDSACSVWKSNGDDQQLWTPSHPPDVSPLCQPAAQRGERRSWRCLGFCPQGHHLHSHPPYQQQVKHAHCKYSIPNTEYVQITHCVVIACFLNSPFVFLINRPVQCDEVSNRSLSLCCDLMTSVCQAALQFCDDALDCHLQVIVGTLTAQVTSRPAISQQVSSQFIQCFADQQRGLQIECSMIAKRKPV